MWRMCFELSFAFAPVSFSFVHLSPLFQFNKLGYDGEDKMPGFMLGREMNVGLHSGPVQSSAVVVVVV